MKITQESDYALKIVLYLANLDKDQIASAREICDSEDISVKFALKILRRLVQEKIVVSFRGIKGGFRLRQDPDKLNVKDVVEAIQGHLSISPSLKGITNKNKLGGSVIDEFLYEVQEDIRKRLTVMTFAKLQENQKNKK